MNAIKLFLEGHAEPKYAAFSVSLLNDSVPVMGVRLPYLRKYARELVKSGRWRDLWENESDRIFEVILLKGLTLAAAPLTDEERWGYIERYVPLITNWALCDSVCTSLRFVRQQPEESWKRLQKYWSSNDEFAQRFGIVMLLDHFLTDHFKDRSLAVFTSVLPAGYYAEVAIAWALSVAFVSFPEQVMTLRKIVESRRVSPKWKLQIRRLRR